MKDGQLTWLKLPAFIVAGAAAIAIVVAAISKLDDIWETPESFAEVRQKNAQQDEELGEHEKQLGVLTAIQEQNQQLITQQQQMFFTGRAAQQQQISEPVPRYLPAQPERSVRGRVTEPLRRHYDVRPPDPDAVVEQQANNSINYEPGSPYYCSEGWSYSDQDRGPRFEICCDTYPQICDENGDWYFRDAGAFPRAKHYGK